MDGTKAAVLVDFVYDDVDDDSDDWWSWTPPATTGKGTLYYVNGSNVTRIAEDVHDFMLADSGNGVVYWLDYDSEFNIAELHLFNGSESALVNIEAHFEGNANPGYTVISPNGRTVFYLMDVVQGSWNTGFESVSFISTNGGRGEEFHPNITPTAISDNAKHIYYVRHSTDESRLVVQNGINTSDTVRLCPEGGNDGVFFNRDYSQVVVNTQGDARISVNGGDSQRFSNTTIRMFYVPRNGQVRGGEHILMMSHMRSNTTVYGFSDFRNKIFRGQDGSLYMIDRNYERGGRFTNDAHTVTLSNDGNRLFFMDSSNRLRSMSASNPEGEAVTIATGVTNYVLGRSGMVYYVNTRNELIRTGVNEGNENDSSIAESVHEVTVAGNGTVFFITDFSWARDEGTLYFTTGTSANKVRDDVIGVFALSNNAFYAMNASGESFDLYRSPANGRFTKIVSDVSGENGNISNQWAMMNGGGW
jgi:hypothetical protein